MRLRVNMDWARKLIAREPVLVGQGVVWVLAQIGAYVVGHTHLVDQSVWNAGTSAAFPVISAAVLGIVAWLTRSVVTPFIDKLDPEEPPVAPQVNPVAPNPVVPVVAAPANPVGGEAIDPNANAAIPNQIL